MKVMDGWCEKSHVQNFIFTIFLNKCWQPFYLISFPLSFFSDHKWCEICRVFVEFSLGAQNFKDSLTYSF